MPPTIPTETKHTSRQVTISVALLLVIILASIFGYRWYRHHTPMKASDLTAKEKQELIDGYLKENQDPNVSPEDRQKAVDSYVQANEDSSANNLTAEEKAKIVEEGIQNQQ